MERSELTAYAKEHYNITEDHKWADFPTFSVLAHPETGKWIALFMTQKQPDGTLTEFCDLKCGQKTLSSLRKPYLGMPRRMTGRNWISVSFGPETERDVVTGLFDKAVKQGTPSGYQIVLENSPDDAKESWHDTAIPRPLPRQAVQGKRDAEKMPAEIVELRRMIRTARQRHPDPADISTAVRAADFYDQAVFMKDYEDDVPWKGYFFQFRPSYSDLTPQQLRGYFTWRSHVRQGKYEHIPMSAVYIYIYELLNGIGVQSPEEALEKIEEFEHGYFSGSDETGKYRSLLQRWKFDFCVLRNLPVETAGKYVNPERIRRDEALAVLRRPEQHSDEEVFEALMVFSEKVRRGSPVITEHRQPAQRLFADVWRRAQSDETGGTDLYTRCFGKMQKKPWYPMWNVLYKEPHPEEERTYQFSAVRSYALENGIWHTLGHNRSSFNMELLRGFLHAADLKLRRHFRTGRALRPRESERWADPYIDAAIRAYEKEQALAARPVINLSAGHLDRIREDAAVTRDSLLTDEERPAEGADDTPEVPAAAELPPETVPAAQETKPLSEMQITILRSLVDGQPVGSILKEAHMMPSIAADEINEALFDVIGDNLIESDHDTLALVEDYREEAMELIGGGSHGRK